jgi:cell division protein FtsI (penicillin-binding protein 3)
MSTRDDIIWRSGIVYFAIALMAVAILVRIIILQFVQREKWAAIGDQFVYKDAEVVANRGDILAADGRLLASSVPYYSIYMDTRSSGMSGSVWSDGIGGLSAGLSRIVGLKSASQWKSDLTKARNAGDRYYLIKRQVDYESLKKLRELPIFREGQYKGGLIAQPENRRILPNMELAARTIGYLNQGSSGNIVGIEGSFNKELSGENGLVVKQRLTGGDWIPVEDENTLQSKDGNDIITTIDIDLQDVAENALMKQLRLNDAHHGCVVLMEVKTGDIKAIANLEISSDGSYHETYNYAVGESTEPGSTFKLASLMVAMDDGEIDINDIVDTGNGTVKYYDKIIRDTKEGGYGKITVKEVFEKSSNVGTAKIIYDHYKTKQKEFVDGLYAMGLNKQLNLQIKGEGTPLIRYPGDNLWSGLSLPMMSYGYEIQMTPLQMLTFYNAVANDGKMVRPRFVKEVGYHGQVIKVFNTVVLNSSIASRSTIKKAKQMLEGVVENGTATNLRNSNYKIAGKTGTAQIANSKYGYKQGGAISYQASFVGYFPADNPLYSCIVVVNAPSNSVYYGNIVAGPVFKEISDKVYATTFFKEVGDVINTDVDGNNIPLAPDAGNGNKDDINKVLKKLNVSHLKTVSNDWITTRESGDTVKMLAVNLVKGLVPDVRGMSLRDAVFVIENSGLKVRFDGKGRVLRQTPQHGARVGEGSVVVLEMNK